MAPRVLNIHKDAIHPDAVNIMRPSKWGNPFVIGRDGTRTQVMAKFRDYVDRNPELRRQALATLRGRDLVCCCKPKACHGDLWLEIANEPAPPYGVIF